MCDYSLQSVKTRKAAVGDKLKTINFGTGTTGFCDPAGTTHEVLKNGDIWNDPCLLAVCVLPGTELAFAEPVKITNTYNLLYVSADNPLSLTQHNLARFRQINREDKNKHHDALEFPDGTIVLLTAVAVGQTATVLQLPAIPMDVAEAEEQRRVEYAG